MNTNLIRLFLCETKGKQVDYAKVADRAVRAGYIVEVAPVQVAANAERNVVESAI